MAIPVEHIEENQKLVDGAGYADLFKIAMRSGVSVFLKSDDDLTWNGDAYEGTAIKLSGVSQHADEKNSRPSLQILNPGNIFNPLIRDGELDRATVTRYRIRRSAGTVIDTTPATAQVHSWTVMRVASLENPFITLELRDHLDGHNFIVPARQFIPPEFPLVSLR